MNVVVEAGKVPVLVPIQHWDGSITYEWRDVDGTSLKFDGVTLRNGETLTVTSDEV